MQTQLHLHQSHSDFTPHSELISLPVASHILTGLALVTAIFALIELALA